MHRGCVGEEVSALAEVVQGEQAPRWWWWCSHHPHLTHMCFPCNLLLACRTLLISLGWSSGSSRKTVLTHLAGLAGEKNVRGQDQGQLACPSLQPADHSARKMTQRTSACKSGLTDCPRKSRPPPLRRCSPSFLLLVTRRESPSFYSSNVLLHGYSEQLRT